MAASHHTTSFRSSIDWSSLLPTLLALFCIVFVICLYLLHIIALCYGKYRLYGKVAKETSSSPGVSIIKPLVGTEDNLRENLRSFFNLQYHKFELMFCVHDTHDDSIHIVKKLMDEYPSVTARIFYGGEEVGLNPKINNMMPAYRAAKYSLVLISDSGIYMRPDALTDMVNSMTKDVALVTQMPYCKDRPGFAGALEQIYFGTSHARIYLAGNCMQFVCSTGMSSLIRKKAMDECGGIQKFGSVLAEDYFFGVELTRKGWKCAISTYPALQNSAGLTVAKFNARICRWMKLRVAMLPHTIVLEPLQDCFMSGLIAAISWKYLFSINPFIYFSIHCIVWYLFDYNLIHVVQNGPLPYSIWEYTIAWMIREARAPCTYLIALCNPDIEWRCGKFRLSWGGTIRQQK